MGVLCIVVRGRVRRWLISISYYCAVVVVFVFVVAYSVGLFAGGGSSLYSKFVESNKKNNFNLLLYSHWMRDMIWRRTIAKEGSTRANK